MDAEIQSALQRLEHLINDLGHCVATLQATARQHHEEIQRIIAKIES